MFSFSVFVCLLVISSVNSAKFVNGSQPILLKTIESLFTERSPELHKGACKVIESSPRQDNICKQRTGLSEILSIAKEQAISACIENFQYDRWNCSLVYNMKPNRKVFSKIYRETALVHALMGASITHAVAKGCASGTLSRCPCGSGVKKITWKGSGCGDEFKHGKRITRLILDFKNAGPGIGNILKRDVLIGVNAIGEQLKEVCKCHGFSGSCTTKTCWKRLSPFSSVMGSLKKQYHHAVKKKIQGAGVVKRSITPKIKKKKNEGKLVYLAKTPNLCAGTKGRACRDRDNCATLCCGRGFVTSKKPVKSRCRCKMANCCFVECDTCVEEVNFYTCK